jgi:hypothetical protein
MLIRSDPDPVKISCIFTFLLFLIVANFPFDSYLSKRRRKIRIKDKPNRHFCKVVSGPLEDHFCQTDCYWIQIWIRNLCSTENKQKREKK